MHLDGLAHRFALRLNAALDEAGFSAIRADRARSLAHLLEQDFVSISHMLNGREMPTWEVLAGICSITKNEPGFFLDATLDKLPHGTHIVHSLVGGGDPVVLRMPESDARKYEPAGARWTYYKADDHMGFGVEPGDILVDFALRPEDQVLRERTVYLFGAADYFELRECVAIERNRVLFAKSGEQQQFALTLPLIRSGVTSLDLAKFDIHHFGEVTSILRDWAHESIAPGFELPVSQY